MWNSVLSRKGPRAAGIGPLHGGPSLGSLLQPPPPHPSRKKTLSLLNQSRISTAARTSQRIQRLEEEEDDEEEEEIEIERGVLEGDHGGGSAVVLASCVKCHIHDVYRLCSR